MLTRNVEKWCSMIVDDFKGRQDLKASKLHKAVKEFDSKLVQNAMWGYAEEKEIPNPTTTVYKLKHSKTATRFPLIHKKK